MFLSCVSKGILVPNLPLICGYINHVNTKHVNTKHVNTKQETSSLYIP